MLSKTLLLNAYYFTTLPWRWSAAYYQQRMGTTPVQVLFYHRVADEYPTPWTISCRAFERQINWLQQRFDLVSLAEAQQRIRSGTNHRPTVAITFDDGYADNCTYALPLLLERQIPVTYFVTSHPVLQQTPFPHDDQQQYPLRPNTVEQIQELARAGVEIGAHSQTHACLGAVTPAQLKQEILGSKHDLEQLLGRPVHYFAFPFGQHSDLSVEGFRIAYEAGFHGVCSAYGGYNLPGKEDFHLERIHADPEFALFRNWLTVDPRKHRICKPFVFPDFRQAHSPFSMTSEEDSSSFVDAVEQNT